MIGPKRKRHLKQNLSGENISQAFWKVGSKPASERKVGQQRLPALPYLHGADLPVTGFTT